MPSRTTKCSAVWSVTGFIGMAIALMIPLQLIFGDEIPESLNGVLGLATIAGGILGFVLSRRGVLPGTRNAETPPRSGHTIPYAGGQ